MVAWSAARSLALRIIRALVILAGSSIGEAVSAQSTLRDGRNVSVNDVIGLTRLGDQNYILGEDVGERAAHFAPDGSTFLVVTRTGDLARGVNRYNLLSWKVAAAVSGNGEPDKLLEMLSSSNRPAIRSESIRWLATGTGITFLGESTGEEQQLYELELVSRKLRRLTSSQTSLVAYDLDQTRSLIVYLAERDSPKLWTKERQSAGLVVSDQPLPDLMTDREGYRFRGNGDEFELFAQVGPRAASKLRTVNHIARGSPVSVSPDGRYVVISTYMPTRSVNLLRQTSDPGIRMAVSAGRDLARSSQPESVLQQFEIVDLQTNTPRLLLTSPAYTTYSPVWSPNSLSVVLSGLPAQAANSIRMKPANEKTSAIIVEASTGRIQNRVFGCTKALAWNPNGVLECDGDESKQVGDIASKSHFRLINGSWRVQPDETKPFTAVYLDEEKNSPPRLMIRPAESKTSIPFYLLNPQLSELSLSRVREISFKAIDGRTLRAGLYYPVNYRADKRYPLVIQTHAWDPNRFWIDGPWGTAFAAQPLAAKGFFVLQVPDQNFPAEFKGKAQYEEVTKAIHTYKGAIDYLSRAGLVDRTRVGIIGFSRTCFYVKFALAHFPYLFAAATVSEGEDGGYLQYLTGFNDFVDPKSLYGGPPFGAHLSKWVQKSPSFNLDRVATPLWINVLNQRFILGDWEWFEGLRLLRKPVEMVVLEDGEHVLERPKDRFVSLSGNVDWFDFWLNGHEDQVLSKRDQYARWEVLCYLQNAQKTGLHRCPTTSTSVESVAR